MKNHLTFLVLSRFLCAWAWNKHDKLARSQTKDRERAKGHKNLCFSFPQVTTMRMFHPKLAAYRKRLRQAISVEKQQTILHSGTHSNQCAVTWNLHIRIHRFVFAAVSHQLTGKIFWRLVWWLNGWSGSRTKCSATKYDGGDVLRPRESVALILFVQDKFTRHSTHKWETDLKVFDKPAFMSFHRTPLILDLVVHPSLYVEILPHVSTV